MESGWLFLKTAGALALVLACFFAFIYALRRWGNFAKRPASRTMMEVLSKHSFGPRHHLVLVKVAGERKILVAISPQNMSLLPVEAQALSGEEPPNDLIEKI